MRKKHLFSYLVFKAIRDTGAETVYYHVISLGNGKLNGPFSLTTARDMIEEALSDLCDRSPYTYTAPIIQSRKDYLVGVSNGIASDGSVLCNMVSNLLFFFTLTQLRKGNEGID